MRFFSVRYEFEIEVLVRLAWRGVHFDFVPITVYYPPKEQRITHFRPFADFARISLLNTVLVLIAFLYIRPRNLYRSLTEKKTFVHSSGCSFLTKTKLFSARHYRWGLAYL
ncbi:MAG: hypothetical protein KatS3mg031_0303 [Chitinophagales bacterium]|nr:MAG: hypothetical protein KatS3mg031_0303 [Chitinophagales bacterium]